MSINYSLTSNFHNKPFHSNFLETSKSEILCSNFNGTIDNWYRPEKIFLKSSLLALNGDRLQQ